MSDEHREIPQSERNTPIRDFKLNGGDFVLALEESLWENREQTLQEVAPRIRKAVRQAIHDFTAGGAEEYVEQLKQPWYEDDEAFVEKMMASAQSLENSFGYLIPKTKRIDAETLSRILLTIISATARSYYTIRAEGGLDPESLNPDYPVENEVAKRFVKYLLEEFAKAQHERA